MTDHRPVCECHGEPMVKGGTQRNGNARWRCRMGEREKALRYVRTPNGRQKQRQYQAKHRESEAEARSTQAAKRLSSRLEDLWNREASRDRDPVTGRPICECHGEPMYVEGRRTKQQYAYGIIQWGCIVRKRESERKNQRDPEKVHKAFVYRTYGVSAEDYDRMAASGCAICGHCPAPGSRRLHVDHLHVPGFTKLPRESKREFVRGLLCGACNSGLGYFRDDERSLASAIEYLDSYSRSLPARHRRSASGVRD